MTPNTDQTNFPLLISESANANLAANALANGNDLLFTASDGSTKLDHEIEKYTSGTGALISWVRIPTLSSSVDTSIYLYYGNPGAANQQNPSGVWDASYQAVWHLDVTPGNTIPVVDSTANNNDGATYGSMNSADVIASRINTGYVFDGVDDYFSSVYNTPWGTQPRTYSFWMDPIATTPDWEDLLVTGSIAASAPAGYLFSFNLEATSDFKYRYNNGNRTWTNITTGTWQHIAIVVPSGATDTSHVQLYRNGQLATGGSLTGGAVTALLSPATPLTLARGWSEVNYRVLKLDELRVSDVGRSADWIKASYNNQNSPATYLGFGAQESLPGGPLKGAIMIID